MPCQVVTPTLLALGVAIVGIQAQSIAPVVIPAKPTPYFSWAVIPTAFHGANRSGIYTDQAVQLLAKHQMVTVEKWYTPCASQGPRQGDPTCAVESKIEHLLSRVKKINPNVTGIMYLNSMFDFAFYTLHGQMLATEARGQPAFLRDQTGAVISLCNDGDLYCNITTFDWTQPAVREMWMNAVTNATASGHVDGIFADHSAQENIQIGSSANHQQPNQLCNGAGAGRTCYNFTAEFKASFNSWHTWITNQSQDILARTTGGPVICGAEAKYSRVGCDFDQIRADQSRVTVLEANGACKPTQDCLAAFLAAAEEGTYLTCFADEPTDWPERDYPLGAPDGPATEGPAGVWTRRFASKTVVVWDNVKKRGSISWGHLAPAVCGLVMEDTGVAGDDLGAESVGSAAACCELCQQHGEACATWAWHAEQQGTPCHLHSSAATVHSKPGCYAGVMNRSMATLAI